MVEYVDGPQTRIVTKKVRDRAEPLPEWEIRRRRRRIVVKMAVTAMAVVMLSIYLLPMGYAFVTSLKTKQQAADPAGPILPSEPVTYDYDGKEVEVVYVDINGETRQLALVKKGRQQSEFIDPADPDSGVIVWAGAWRTLEPVRGSAFQWSNYPEAWESINFPRLLFWTLFYAGITLIGAVASSAFVAYGFARFRFPGRSLLFIILIGTIVLPPAVTLIPQYVFFSELGWTSTWSPLIVPLMFGNAYNVFLLRQYFLTIPREMEHAAAVDGAGPVRTFLQVIIPQAVPALTAVSLFHFFFAWNDFFGPLVFLAGNRDIVPISVGLSFFNGTYDTDPNLIMAASFISLAIPLAIFFFSQRVFLSGIVITGVDK